MSEYLGVITLAALLHDIGKVKQRAEKKKTYENPFTNGFIRR